MENKFLKTYVYLILIVGLANLIAGTLYRFFPNSILKALMFFVTIPEIPLFVLSIVAIFYVFTKKVDKIHLILPIFYLALYLTLAIVGIIVASKGKDPLDLSDSFNNLLFIITWFFYLSQILFVFYLLKKKKNSFQVKYINKDIKKGSKTLGVVSIVLGGLSFIPLIGLFVGIAAIVTGIIDIKKNKSKLGIIGLVLGIIGILITIGLYGGLFYFGFVKRGGMYDNLRTGMVKSQLPNTINAIESYKVRYGKYPDTIEDLSKIADAFSYTDPLQIVGFENRTTTYYYENKGSYYYLFSKGVDGQPFTKDDVFPEFKESPGNIGYRKPNMS